MLWNHRRRMLCVALLALVPVWLPNAAEGDDATGKEAIESAETGSKRPPKKVNLPGLTLDLEKRCVDLEAIVCLDEGMLELIACTKGTKEHESIVSITAKPMHVHTALLLLGLKNGNPAMRRPIDEQRTRWMHMEPRGDPVEVYLVFENAAGVMAEHPIGEFVVRSKGDADGLAPAAGDDDEEVKFPNTFLFAGSHLYDNGRGQRQYLADKSGNVISISTFGDDLLCLPGIHSNGADELVWEVDATKLPKVGSKVTLRLRPQARPASDNGR